MIDMAMATYMANRLDADPVWIFFNGPPASSKTEILMSMKNHRETFFLSALTKNTFLSGKSKKDKDTGEEKDCSLLPYMTGKLVVIKDFTTVLSLQKDARAEIYSQLREIYDGHFAKAFGAGDGRKSWDGKNRHHLRSNPRH